MATRPSSWTAGYYPRHGDGVGFDRVVFFSDAVFAIAITLLAIDIGVPELEGPGTPGELWSAVLEKTPAILAFMVAFIWVAFYWRANHRFTTSLKGMSSRYVGCVLLYLALIAFLPLPAGILGEYWENPLAVVIFLGYVSLRSAMEVLLVLVAARAKLFVEPIGRRFRRWSILGSLTPVAAFLLAIPVAFASTLAAMVCVVVLTVGFGFLLSKAFGGSAPDPST